MTTYVMYEIFWQVLNLIVSPLFIINNWLPGREFFWIIQTREAMILSTTLYKNDYFDTTIHQIITLQAKKLPTWYVQQLCKLPSISTSPIYNFYQISKLIGYLNSSTQFAQSTIPSAISNFSKQLMDVNSFDW